MFGELPRIDTLTPERMAEIVLHAGEIRSWLKDVEEYAIDKVYSGALVLPGVKVVQGSGRRTITDPQGFLKALEREGVKTDGMYETIVKLSAISTLERKLKMKLENSPGAEFIAKSEGKLTLVPESDKRAAVSSLGGAQAAFAAALA